jgi:hypothetical protein
MTTPLQMVEAIFLLAAKFMCTPGAIKAEQNTSSTRLNIPQLKSENIRESILDFTALLGEINPDMPYCILHRDKETDSSRDCRGIRIEHRSGVQADGDPPFVLLLSGKVR